MNFDAGSRTRLFLDLNVDLDPTGATVELRVGSTWHPVELLDDPVQVVRNGKVTYRQTGRTTDYFAGPAVAAPAGAVELQRRKYPMEGRVTSGADIITFNLPLLSVL